MTSLLLLIVFARLLGRLFVRMNQPEIVGEILAGVILGPAVLGYISPSLHGLSGIAELAVFLVILAAGLEMNFKDIIDVFKGKNVFFSIIGFLVPFILATIFGVIFQLGAASSVFLGLIISITALPVALRMLRDFGWLESEIASYTMATVIVADVLALLALGVVLQIPESGDFMEVATAIFLIGGKLMVLITFIASINIIIEKLIDRGFHLERVPEKIIATFGNEALFGMVVLFVLIFGSVSESLGFHFIIGAFFGALMIDRKFFLARRYKELEKTIESVSAGFLAPVFFAYVGLEFNFAAIESYWFVFALLALAVASKWLAGYLGAKVVGISSTTGLAVGTALCGRGVMDLVVANIAFEKGFIDQGLFSSLVIVGALSTLIGPQIYRRFVMSADTNSKAVKQ